jgi:hypothetical protein
VPFPVSITGSLELELAGGDADAAVERLIALLRRAKARSILRTNYRTTFTGGIFRPVLGINILTSIGWGEIDVEKRGASSVFVTWRLSTVQLLVFITVALVAIPIAVILLSSSSWSAHFIQNLRNVLDPGALIVGWIWLFIGNYILARWRFRAWLRSALTV